MPAKDLKGKTVYDLPLEDFEELFCRCCTQDERCPKANNNIIGCRYFVDGGLWDQYYRKS